MMICLNHSVNVPWLLLIFAVIFSFMRKREMLYVARKKNKKKTSWKKRRERRTLLWQNRSKPSAWLFFNSSRRILKIVSCAVASHIVRRSNRPAIHPYSRSTVAHLPSANAPLCRDFFPKLCERTHADDVTGRTIGRAGVHVTARLARVWRVTERQKEMRQGE